MTKVNRNKKLNRVIGNDIADSCVVNRSWCCVEWSLTQTRSSWLLEAWRYLSRFSHRPTTRPSSMPVIKQRAAVSVFSTSSLDTNDFLFSVIFIKSSHTYIHTYIEVHTSNRSNSLSCWAYTRPRNQSLRSWQLAWSTNNWLMPCFRRHVSVPP